MCHLTTRHFGQDREQESHQGRYAVVDRKQHGDPVCPIVVELGGSVSGTIDMAGNCLGGVDPHGKQGEPGKELDPGQLFHGPGHVEQVGHDDHKPVAPLLFPDPRCEQKQQPHHPEADGQDIEFLLQVEVIRQQGREDSKKQHSQSVGTQL